MSCSSKVTKANNLFAGKWLKEDNRFGKGYTAGELRDYDIVKKFMDAYENKDAATMVVLSADTVKFHPADLAGVFDVDITNTNFIKDR